MQKQIFDYPFNSWEEYYPALTQQFCSELPDPSRPKYQELASDNFECNIAIIQSLLEQGNDAQKGLDMFFQSMIDGDRYSFQIVGGEDSPFAEIIKLFLEKGAVIHIDILLKREDTPSRYFEEAQSSYFVRGAMLKAIKQEFIPDLEAILNEKIGWDNITPMYWEDMLDVGEKGDELDPTFGDIDTALYKILKSSYDEFIPE